MTNNTHGQKDHHESEAQRESKAEGLGSVHVALGSFQDTTLFASQLCHLLVSCSRKKLSIGVQGQGPLSTLFPRRHTGSSIKRALWMNRNVASCIFFFKVFGLVCVMCK